MVDPEPGAYRPRRAFLEPDPSENEPGTPDVDDSRGTSAASASNGSSARRARSRALLEPAESPDFAAVHESQRSDEPASPQTPPDVATSDSFPDPRSDSFPDSRSTTKQDSGSEWAVSRRSIFADLDNDDAAPPLYRDGSSAPGSEATTTDTTGLRQVDMDEAQVDTGRQTWVRPALASAPRRFRPPDTEATTILPRTSTTSANSRGWQDSIDDFADIDQGRSRFGRRTKLAMLIAGVAAVVLIGLVIGRAALVGDTPTTSPSTGNTTGPTSAASAVPPEELLNDDAMLNAKDAKRVSSDRTWKVAYTQRGTTPESDTPACLAEPAEDQPVPALTMLRGLTGGKDSLGILHEANAFTSPEDAGQAYAVAARALGGCAEMGGYIRSGWSVKGLGDKAVGVVVTIERNGKTMHHSVVLNRTGKVTNVLDVARTGDPVDVGKVANALAAATDRQCGKAGGTCPEDVSVKAAPPPIGGDEPGFLAAGDLPPVGSTPSLWVGDAPDVPREGFGGSQCENVNWATLPASARTARTYLLDEGPDPAFGLDEIILTMKNDKAASKFVADLRATVDKCPKRKLTASVPSPKSVSGPGAGGTKVAGWAVTVRQKVGNGSLKYRLGAVAAGPKVVYTFLSPKGKLDLSDDEWRMVAVRAGQRATQVS